MPRAPREDIQNARTIIGQGRGWIDSNRALRAARLFRRRLLLFWGRRLFRVISWTRDSNWAAADAPVKLILLRFGVRWTVDPVASLADVFQNHRIRLQAARLAAFRSAPHVLESRRA